MTRCKIPWALLLMLAAACANNEETTPPDNDQTSPKITEPQPSGTLASGSTSATMSVKTDENATCKWDTDGTASYEAMANTFATTGGTAHSTPLSGLADGQSYQRYVRCIDGQGNANTTSTVISWSIAGTTTGSAVLAWGASVSDATHSAADGYRIKHCVTTGGNTCNKFVELATVDASKLTYTAAGLKTGTHCFQVTAYNSAGESDPANCTSANGCCKSIP